MLPGRTALVDTLRIGAGVLAILVGAAAFSVATGPGRFTTYASRSSMSATLTLATGAALVVAGLVASLGCRMVEVGDLGLLAGLTWFVPALVGWAEGPPLIRGLALVGTGLTLPLVVHLVIRGLALRAGPWRAIIVAAYAAWAAAAATFALFRDPYLDPSCFANCTVNPFLVHSMPGLARSVEELDRWLAAGTGLLLACLGLARLAAGSGSRRRSLSITVPAVVVGGAITARAVLGLQRPREDPFDDLSYALYLATSAGLVLLAGGLLAGVVGRERRRRALTQLAIDLVGAPPAGQLEAALAEALGDPDLRLAYPVQEPTRLVDAHGHRVQEPRPGDPSQTTTLTREGRAIAVITHARSHRPLEHQLASSVQLGLANERLQAEILARLDELRASRERIVEAGDRERRRLERDLHDGAQQRLLALSYDVRLASAAATAEGDTLTETSLRRASEITKEVLSDLRELARGIFPAALAEVGLSAALRTFADLAPIPLELRVDDVGRHSALVEAAAYFGVVEAVEDASHRGATSATITVHREREHLVIAVDDDGETRTSPLTALEDRIGAIGGSVNLDPTRCRLDIPCA